MQSLPLPKQITKTSGDGSHAVFVIEPLYPGYGQTVGNALRRVLLSSLEGAAISSVKVEGASHEFSTLPFVKEDMVDIVLNLKMVRLRMHGDGPVTINLSAKGEKKVTAGDISRNSDVEVVNPDHVIATLTDKAAKLDLELTVTKGRGYVPVEQREKEKHDIGTIAIDSIYTPLKNVNFTTEHVRVEQITNYDKLVLDITTDGSIDPSDALNQAAKLLLEHFQFIAGGVDTATETEVIEVEAAAPHTDTFNMSGEPEEAPKKKTRKKKEAEE